MSGFRISASILGFAAALLLSPAAKAAGECKDLKQFIKDETAGAQKYVDIFTFRKNHRGDSVLLLFKDTIEKGVPPKHWLFLNRPQTETNDFCVMGRGEEFGQHDDMHEDTYSNQFGEPGSGYPRCATRPRTRRPRTCWAPGPTSSSRTRSFSIPLRRKRWAFNF